MRKFLWALLGVIVILLAYGAFIWWQKDRSLSNGKIATRPYDFEKTGNLTLPDEIWILVYEEPGKPALSVALTCNPEKPKEFPCSPNDFNIGDRVLIKGWTSTSSVVVDQITTIK